MDGIGRWMELQHCTRHRPHVPGARRAAPRRTPRRGQDRRPTTSGPSGGGSGWSWRSASPLAIAWLDLGAPPAERSTGPPPRSRSSRPVRPVLSTLVSHESAGTTRESTEEVRPQPDRPLQSKGLAEQVVNDPASRRSWSPLDDAGRGADRRATSRRQAGHARRTCIVVTLEGNDPARTQELLEPCSSSFKKQAQRREPRQDR